MSVEKQKLAAKKPTLVGAGLGRRGGFRGRADIGGDLDRVAVARQGGLVAGGAGHGLAGAVARRPLGVAGGELSRRLDPHLAQVAVDDQGRPGRQVEHGLAQADNRRNPQPARHDRAVGRGRTLGRGDPDDDGRVESRGLRGPKLGDDQDARLVARRDDRSRRRSAKQMVEHLAANGLHVERAGAHICVVERGVARHDLLDRGLPRGGGVATFGNCAVRRLAQRFVLDIEQMGLENRRAIVRRTRGQRPVNRFDVDTRRGQSLQQRLPLCSGSPPGWSGTINGRGR